MPAQGWSCETLEQGVLAAAAVSGMEIRSENMQEAGWEWFKNAVKNRSCSVLKL